MPDYVDVSNKIAREWQLVCRPHSLSALVGWIRALSGAVVLASVLISVAVDVTPVYAAEASHDTGEVDQRQDEGPTSTVRTGTRVDRPQEQTSGLEEIIVNAQRVDQRVQDVPITLQILSSEQLRDQSLLQLADYAKEIPGLNFIGGSGGAGNGVLAIRGISTGQDSTSLTAIYLDDVPFSASSSVPIALDILLDPDPNVIDHLEVLEGPQGTLYGARSMGGLIKFVTKRPDLENFTANVGTSGVVNDSGGGGYGVRGSVNVPIVAGEVAARASVSYRQDPGFVDNAYYGTTNVNFNRIGGAQLSVLFKISDALRTTVNAFTQHTYDADSNLVYLDPATFKPSLGHLAYSSPFVQPNHVDANSLSDTTVWEAKIATITNVLSYANIRNPSNVDFGQFAIYAQAPPGTSALFYNDTSSSRWTDELRAASTPGRLEWLLGVFLTRETDYNIETIRGTSANGQFLDPSSEFYNLYTFRTDYRYNEEALFADLTYHFNDQFVATVGIRHSWDDQPWHEVYNGVFGGGTAPVYNSSSTSDSGNAYLGTITFKPDSNMTMYLRAASGYRPAASQALAPDAIAAGLSTVIKRDHLWDYEGGIKGTAWGNKLSYAADAFHMVWTDLQLSVQLEDGFFGSGNVGSAKSDGAEGLIQVMPLPGLTLSLKGAYVNARITADVPTIHAVSGEPMPYSPRIVSAASLDYRLNGMGTFMPNFGLTYAYHGSVDTGFTAGAPLGSNGVYRLPSYASVDFRTGIQWSRYRVNATIMNIRNEYGLTRAAGTVATGTPLAGVIITPRTFALAFEAHL